MKKIINYAFALFAFTLVFSSCKKVENQVTFDGGTPPTLTSNNASPLVLLLNNKDNPGIAFNWTNPNYKFNTGGSSQNVTYTLQIDTAGSNFKNPKMSETVIPNALGLSLTVGELNKKLLSMELPWGISKNLNARIKSTLANNTVPLFSNVVNFTATAYLDAAVTPPGTAPTYADGNLFLVGSATQGGWNNPVPVPTQKFTKIDATHYEITVPMNGGQSYLMLPTNGDWSRKYGALCSPNNCNEPMSFDFKAEGSDVKAPAANGTYTIKVNFVSGKITVQ